MAVRLDTVIVDEAGCVLEYATPLLLRLHPSNLVMVGDHLQLEAFTHLVDPPQYHCRWLVHATFTSSPLHTKFIQASLQPGAMVALRACHGGSHHSLGGYVHDGNRSASSTHAQGPQPGLSIYSYSLVLVGNHVQLQVLTHPTPNAGGQGHTSASAKPAHTSKHRREHFARRQSARDAHLHLGH